MAIVMEELTSEYGDQEDVFCEARKAGALTARDHVSQALVSLQIEIFVVDFVSHGIAGGQASADEEAVIIFIDDREIMFS